eukprot:NODE_86_length_22075_cov_1.190253.p18 type:complete len:103 gc:universal NODE_86_length_22075_cov_1.190253:7148-6840(-)
MNCMSKYQEGINMVQWGLITRIFLKYFKLFEIKLVIAKCVFVIANSFNLFFLNMIKSSIKWICGPLFRSLLSFYIKIFYLLIYLDNFEVGLSQILIASESQL